MSKLTVKRELEIITNYLTKCEIFKMKHISNGFLKTLAYRIMSSICAERRAKAHRTINKLQHEFVYHGEECDRNIIRMLAQVGCEEQI